jgi:cobalamin biosynthesis Mg chelatase CobN
MTRSGDGRPASKDPAEMQAQTEQTRAELGQTLSALSERANVKGLVSEAAGKAKQRAKQAGASSASAAADKAKNVASTAANKTAELSNNVAAEISGTAEKAADMAGHGVERARRNPLPFVAAAVGAVAIGALAASFAIRRRRR